MLFVPILVKLDEIGDGVSLVWADFAQRLHGREGAAGNVELRIRPARNSGTCNWVDCLHQCAYNAFMAMNQYTIRSVPDRIDRELRRRAGEEQKSLNAVIIEALEKAIGVQSGPTEHTDLDFLIGSWEEDPMFDEVIADFEQLDEEGMWR